MLRQRRNALAQQEEQYARQGQFRNALQTGGVNAAAQVDPIAAQPLMEQEQTKRSQALQGVAAKAWGIYTAQSPRMAAQSSGILASMAEEVGKPPEALTDDDVRALARQDAYKAISAGGLDPRQFKEPEAPAQSYGVTEAPGPFGSRILTNGRTFQVVEPPKPKGSGGGPKPPSGYQYATDPATGETILAPVRGGPADPNRPRPSSPAQEKQKREAIIRMPQVDAAIRRVDRLSQASQSLGNFLADGGPIDGPLLSKTKSGQELEQSAASLMPVLTALTRVPGIGAQSDLEQRLAMLQLPSVDMYPEVRARAVAELQAFMRDLRQAYVNLAAGTGVQMPEEGASAGVVTQGAAPGGGVVDFGSLK